ncbi:Ubiquinone biosynthesis protein coq9, mitochondrial [Gaertneriomyces sp. JEL0708]|nr:Ubiquinone biosynthesis protein coq9, mitochondrial [Gaertneriomyces sp. JEL0708]
MASIRQLYRFPASGTTCRRLAVSGLSSAVTRTRCLRHHSSTSAPKPPVDYKINLSVPAEITTSNAAKSSPDVRTKILLKSVEYVGREGFTIQAVQHAVSDLGLPSVAHAAACPDGVIDLIEFVMEEGRRRMVLEMSQKDLTGIGVTGKIRQCLQSRLEYSKLYIHKWPEALAVLAVPTNAPVAVRALATLVDDMWHIAGDKSVDMNWYSKRAMLSAVFSSTELYMTQDRSRDFEETGKFMERRLQDVATVGKASGALSGYINFAKGAISGVFASIPIEVKAAVDEASAIDYIDLKFAVRAYIYLDYV